MNSIEFKAIRSGRRVPQVWASLLCLLCAVSVATAQQSDATAAALHWTATWISHPTAPLREPLTLHFRRDFTVAPGTQHFVIHVSADNRFILYLNGSRVGAGPARGDLSHWRYETFDIGPELRAGENTLCATVWNFGVYAPTAQITDRIALLVQGDTAAESLVNTDARWMVEVESGHTAYPRQSNGFWHYMAVGPGEALHAADYDWDWQTEPMTGPSAHGSWVPASSAMRESIYPSAGIAGARGTSPGNPWQLVPDPLPAMSYSQEPAGHIVRTDLPGRPDFPAHPVTVSPRSHVHILLDRASLTTAYPRLEFSGGKGSRIDLTYAEALYDAKQQKGDRSEVADRRALGMHDLILADGGEHRAFEALWWRTWRFLDVEITTEAEPLRLDGLQAFYSAYPFDLKAHFTSSDPELNQIWKIGWHSLELDAHETYMDTPYYEQLQYVGDSRIEAMITYVATGDIRLPLEAIRAFDDSRRADGLTASRAPSSLAQFIPPFSLLWIGMVHDFALYREDPSFVREVLPGTRAVLHWFAGQQNANGLVHKLPDWSFVDWTADGDVVPSYDPKGQSCLLTLEYIGSLSDAAELEAIAGQASMASSYQAQLELAKRAVREGCWDEQAGLLADSPAKNIYSQHSNTLGVLYDVIPKAQQDAVMYRILHSNTGAKVAPALIPATYYFDYYVARALEHAGLGDRYLDLIQAWRSLLPLHFTTWPETPGGTRSDSHAWSADPTYDLLTIVAGIAPASPGFQTVRISPHLGALKTLDAAMPHERGIIHVNYVQQEGGLSATVELPPGLTGVFVWKGQQRELRAGSNVLKLRDPAFDAAQGHSAAKMADVSGIWVWSRQGSDGTQRQNFFTITQTRSGFTGKMEYPWGGEVGLEDGSVSGTDIRFRQHGDAPSILYSGKLDGDHMRLTREENGQSTLLDLVRLKPGEPMFAKAPSPPPLEALPSNHLAKLPPMGWNAWNHFHDDIDDKTVREIADAMISSGMRDAGYHYVNIDDEWAGERDSGGNIHPNRNFPDMKALADYMHSRNMKLGLYSSPGPETCEGHHGSLGFEQKDAETYAAWGADYLKYDWCSAAFVYQDQDMQAVYQKMGKALESTGRPIVYSLCQYGREQVAEWGPRVAGNLWRTTPDISDNWKSMIWIWSTQQSIAQWNKPGGWNDPDMLEVGNGGMTDEEYRTHFSLWSMLSAPLIAGNDPRSMSQATLATLTNKDVIAIDQDTLASPPRRVAFASPVEVWLKTLGDGGVVVLLLNSTEVAADVDLRWNAIGLGDERAARDLWSHEELGRTREFAGNIAPHAVRMLRLSADRQP